MWADKISTHIFITGRRFYGFHVWAILYKHASILPLLWLRIPRALEAWCVITCLKTPTLGVQYSEPTLYIRTSSCHHVCFIQNSFYIKLQIRFVHQGSMLWFLFCEVSTVLSLVNSAKRQYAPPLKPHMFVNLGGPRLTRNSHCIQRGRGHQSDFLNQAPETTKLIPERKLLIV